MNSALGLMVITAVWYVGGAMRPAAAGILTFIPFVGVACLVGGLILGVARRRFDLAWLLLSLLLSEVYVGFAGFFHGEVKDPGLLNLVFAALQLGLLGWLLYRLKDARLPAALLALSCLCYAWFATFIASMAFTNTWL